LVGFGAVADAHTPAASLHWLAPNEDDFIGASLREVRAEPVPPTRRRSNEFSHDGDEDATDDYSIDRFDEGQVDDILAKVHVAGVQSLTANERAILERASQRFQQRRRPLD
jgi:hypothetical protein